MHSQHAACCATGAVAPAPQECLAGAGQDRNLALLHRRGPGEHDNKR